MTTMELYRDLCVEAGTATPDTDPCQLWDDSWHNIGADLSGLLLAVIADNDVAALAECRRMMGLPAFA